MSRHLVKKTTLEPISFQSSAVSLDAKLAASQRQARHEGRKKNLRGVNTKVIFSNGAHEQN